MTVSTNNNSEEKPSRDMVKANFGNCRDICVTPLQGEPRLLTMVAPVIYDEVGINLCKTINLSELETEQIDRVDHIILEVLDIRFNQGEEISSYVEFIPERPYCSRVVLSKMLILFSGKLFDDNNQFLETIIFGAYYLDSGSLGSSKVLNSNEIIVELYTPYGTSYEIGELQEVTREKVFIISKAKPMFHFMGMSEVNNKFPQGIVMQALAKAGSINLETKAVSVGVTLSVKSVYSIPYKLPHAGMEIPPKLEINTSKVGACINFHSGELLSRNIKPLDLGHPMFEENLKNEC